MTHVPFIRSSLLLVALGACGAQAVEAATTRLSREVVPTFQAIDLAVDAGRADYQGSVRIDLEVREPVRSFRFHSEGSALARVVLTREGRELETTHAMEGSDVVRLTAARTLDPGAYVLHVEFTNDFDTQAASLYRLETGGYAYTFTQFESNDAREAFPCWDEPEFKIPYQFTLTVPASHMAITNTPIVKSTPVNGHTRLEFAKTKPLPSYLLAIATGPFDAATIEGLSVPGRIITPRGQIGMAKHAIRMTPPLLEAFEAYFGQPYPFEKLDVIAVPEYWYGAMENPGAITFVDNVLLLPEEAGVPQLRTLARYMAHELAHMWFGDLVTMEWWDDLWLNESFASWLGEKITEQVHPEYQVEVRELIEVDQARTKDALSSTKPMRRPVQVGDNLAQMADALAYWKGQAVLGMFEQWLGPDVFRKGVRLYLKENEWGNATAADLWDALSRASRTDVAGPMRGFLDQAGMPLIRAEMRPGGRVRLTQERFHNFGIETDTATRWQVPVTLKYFDGSKVRTQSVLLEKPSQTVRLKSGKSTVWVHPNADERGYYRWSLSKDMLEALADDAREHLTTRERKGYLSNLTALLDAGEVSGEDFLRLLEHFASDPEPEVIGGLLAGLDKVHTVFITEDLRKPFGLYVQQTLQAPVGRFGLESLRGEPAATSSLRPGLMQRMAELGHDQVALGHAESLADAFFENPALVDPGMVSAALRVAAFRGDQARFEAYRKRFESTEIPAERRALLNAFSFFRTDSIVEQVLAYALEGPLRPQEIGRIPLNMMQIPERRDRVFRWITENYDEIASRIPNDWRIYMPRFAGGCSQKRLDAARAFFADPAHSPPGTELELEETVSTVEDCLSLREREGASIAAYLRGPVGAR